MKHIPSVRESMANSEHYNIPKEPDGHYYWLDLIRFLAAFAVMASHFRGSFFVEYSALPLEQQNPIVFFFYFITRLGFEAVLIFFVLSGILVGAKSFKRLKNKTFRATDYIIDRTVRIQLPLISSLLFYLPIAIIFDYNLNPIAWIGTLFSLQGILTSWPFETLWSLSYEVWFYIVMLAIAFLWKSDNKKFILGLIIISTCMLVFTKLNCTLLFVWFLGAFTFNYFPNKNKILLCLFFLLAIILIVILQFTSGTHVLEGHESENANIRNIFILIFGLTCTLFISQLIKFKPQSKYLLNLNYWGTKLAAFSYTLYLSHIPVLRLMEGLGLKPYTSINGKSFTFYLISLVIALIVAYVLYFFFERNTDKVKKYIKSKLNNIHNEGSSSFCNELR